MGPVVELNQSIDTDHKETEANLMQRDERIALKQIPSETVVDFFEPTKAENSSQQSRGSDEQRNVYLTSECNEGLESVSASANFDELSESLSFGTVSMPNQNETCEPIRVAKLPDGTGITVKAEIVSQFKRTKKENETKDNYICEVCCATFLRNRDLKSHENFKHSGTECDKCSQCNKVFAERSSLTRHKKNHDGLMPE